MMILLQVAWPLKAGDEQDKVFALRGIANEIAHRRGLRFFPLKVDYGLSVKEIFTQAAATIMRQTQSLALLALVHLQSQRYDPRLPSWVPDFAKQGPAPLRALMFIPGHPGDDARRIPRSRSPENYAPFSIDGGELSIYSTALGTIAEAGGSGHDLVERGRLEGCAKMMLKIDEIYPFTGQDRVEVLWRTLICDVDVSSRSQPHLNGAQRSVLSLDS
jgi:hypothetical protein